MEARTWAARSEILHTSFSDFLVLIRVRFWRDQFSGAEGTLHQSGF
jgi:hypothetical protein